MNLGDLEFRAEHFKTIKMPMTNGKITTDIIRLDEALSLINSRRKELLEKAPVATCDWPPHLEGLELDEYASRPYDGREWSFRMVCGEEVGE